MKEVKPRKPRQLKLRANIRIRADMGYDYSDDEGAQSVKIPFVDFEVGALSLSGEEARRIASWLRKEYAPWADSKAPR